MCVCMYEAMNGVWVACFCASKAVEGGGGLLSDMDLWFFARRPSGVGESGRGLAVTRDGRGCFVTMRNAARLKCEMWVFILPKIDSEVSRSGLMGNAACAERLPSTGVTPAWSVKIRCAP